ncbi:MAG: hypothetical protein JSS12_07485 [Verrucomicrobia bacterium]|nr:hypothetical protein [Verrucomicrobiota bacterium]
MNRLLRFFLWTVALSLTASGYAAPPKGFKLTAPAQIDHLKRKNVLKTQARKPVKQQHHHHHCDPTSPVTQLQPAYPWEVVVDNKQTFRFIVMNYFTDLFDQTEVETVSKAAQDYINKYFFPSWRVQATVEFFVPPSMAALAEQFVIPGSYVTAIPQAGTYVPIFLVDQFSENVEPDFATAVHGSVSGIVMNGYSHLVYLSDDDTQGIYPNLPFGTPWIVIPAGTVESGNGINAAVAFNQSTGQGPTDFYSELALTLAHEMIEVMVNPTGLLYTIAGNPLGFGVPEGTPTRNQFYLHEAVDPVSHGNDNLLEFQGWLMPNFVLPAYFFPFANEVSHDTARYDLLGHVAGPFQPHKGTQFVIYQDQLFGDLTELSVGQYESTVDDPGITTFTSFGSIYEYEGWGLLADTEYRQDTKDKIVPYGERNAKVSNMDVKHAVRVLSGSHVGARKPLKQAPMAKAQSKHQAKFASGVLTPEDFPCGELTEPYLLPFQYIDDNGFLTQRYLIVNYLPVFLIPEQIDAAIPVMEKYFQENFLPYWNRKVDIIGNVTIATPNDPIPDYDGTFVPMFVIPDEFFDLDSFGADAITAGAFNTNNNLNPYSGPQISDYWKPFGGYTVPDLLLGNPYLIFPRHNIAGQVDVVAKVGDTVVAGPFIAVPLGSADPADLPFAAEGAIADPLDACFPLTPGSMDGKIGLNIREGCNSLVYPNNMADAGAIATLTGWVGGATGFSGSGALVFGATMSQPDMEALMAAVEANPTAIISISTLHGGLTDIQTFVGVETHELAELLVDPTYGDFIVYSNPPTDRAVLFVQYETADTMERLAEMITDGVNSYVANPFNLPAYFVPNLRTNNYDDLGMCWRALIPLSRDQILWQQEGGPTSIASTYGLLESSVGDLDFQNSGSIFNLHTFVAPFDTPSYENPDPEIPMDESPLAPIYEELQTLDSVILL